jgi:GFO/IDH/MocA oxidoreductase family protein
MLDEARPEIVVIATPLVTHHAMVLRAFAAGAHVLCEKPLALTRAEAQAMVDAAARAGRIGMTAFSRSVASRTPRTISRSKRGAAAARSAIASGTRARRRRRPHSSIARAPRAVVDAVPESAARRAWVDVPPDPVASGAAGANLSRLRFPSWAEAPDC